MYHLYFWLYWVPWTPTSHKATSHEPFKHPLGGRWENPFCRPDAQHQAGLFCWPGDPFLPQLWLLTNWGQSNEQGSGTPSPSSSLWNQNIDHCWEMYSLLIPQPLLENHSKYDYHKILEKYPNPYNLYFFLKPSLVPWHMVQIIDFFCALHFIVPQSSFLLPLLAGATRTSLGLSDKCFKSASNSMGWNLAG